MLRVFWLTVLLAMASAVAGAQPAQAPTVAPNVSMTTDKAQAAAVATEQRVSQLAVKKSQIAQRYQDELAAIDRLKQEKSSWRRERELQASLADSADTAKQLQQVNSDLAASQRNVQVARAGVVTAIDAEIAAGAEGPRAQKLAKLRAQLAPPVVPAAKKIVIPDAEIDPLADPAELDEQAAAIRQSETELSRQITGLDTQVTDLKYVADLRGQHQRAIDLELRDDDQPHRNGQRSTGRGAADSAAPTTLGTGGGAGTGSGAGAGGGTDTTTSVPTATSAFESQLTVTLGDVIDHTTIEGLLRASRSGDPAQRAEAAQQVRDAVAARLEQLKRKRAAIELRAKSLRKR